MYIFVLCTELVSIHTILHLRHSGQPTAADVINTLSKNDIAAILCKFELHVINYINELLMRMFWW